MLGDVRKNKQKRAKTYFRIRANYVTEKFRGMRPGGKSSCVVSATPQARQLHASGTPSHLELAKGLEPLTL